MNTNRCLINDNAYNWDYYKRIDNNYAEKWDYLGMIVLRIWYKHERVTEDIYNETTDKYETIYIMRVIFLTYNA